MKAWNSLREGVVLAKSVHSFKEKLNNCRQGHMSIMPRPCKTTTRQINTLYIWFVRAALALCCIILILLLLCNVFKLLSIILSQTKQGCILKTPPCQDVGQFSVSYIQQFSQVDRVSQVKHIVNWLMSYTISFTN